MENIVHLYSGDSYGALYGEFEEVPAMCGEYVDTSTNQWLPVNMWNDLGPMTRMTFQPFLCSECKTLPGVEFIALVEEFV